MEGREEGRDERGEGGRKEGREETQREQAVILINRKQ